jgi:hypothetical protein
MATASGAATSTAESGIRLIGGEVEFMNWQVVYSDGGVVSMVGITLGEGVLPAGSGTSVHFLFPWTMEFPLAGKISDDQ